ncbi:MAG: branched-chain amino acid aminotransferase [Planctomycetaceae bacterium]
MSQLLRKLRDDECGMVQSAELVLIATITVIGMIVGLSELTSNVNQELIDVGNAFNQSNQSYSTWDSAGPNSPALLDTCG